jgi:hypothetical protein
MTTSPEKGKEKGGTVRFRLGKFALGSEDD